MSAKDAEQIYHIYLFEMLLLCCKESSRDSKKKRSSKSLNNAADIKGKIYAKSISDVVHAKDGRFEVKVFWNEMEESFMLKCRNEEQADLWANRISLCASGKTSNFRLSSDKAGLVHRSNAHRRGQSYYDNTNTDQNGYPPSVVESNDRSSKVTSLPLSARSSNNRSSDGLSLANQSNIGLRRDTSRDALLFPKRSSSNLGGSNPNLIKSSLPNSTAAKAPSSTLPQPHTSFLSETAGDPTHQRSATNGAPSIPLSIPAPRPLSIPPPAPPPKSSLPIPPSGPPKIPLPPVPNSISPESITSQLTETHLAPPSSKLPLPPTVPPKEEVQKKSAVNVQSSSIVVASGLVKMKTHYGADIFVLAVSADGPKFEEILDRIERKIRICGAAMPEGRRVKLRYRDEDGDLITINGDDDIEFAFEMARRTSQNGTITIQAE
jgi:cell division control protein 24